MLTAYDNYKLSHAGLFTAGTQTEIHQASNNTVEYYLENRLIWKELNHYKEKGMILGEHPIFSRLRRLDEIRRMKTGELVTMKIAKENNLVRNRAALRRQPDHPQTLKRKERIKILEQELMEVNRLLNL